MIPTPVFHLPDDLPPQTALALFDLLRGLIDALWQQYETELLELIMDEPEADRAGPRWLDRDPGLISGIF